MMILIPISGLLILLFTLAGIFKLIRTKDQIAKGGGAWAADFEASHIKIIGAVELALAAFLLFGFYVLPNIYLTRSSTVGMTLIMLAATVVHIRRKEYGFVILTIVLAIMASLLSYISFS